MKKIIYPILLMALALMLTACVSSPKTKTPSSLDNIQNVVRETQKAFENNDLEETQQGITKLLKLSEDPLYSESERLIANYCAIYIKAGTMLDYIIKNDKPWLETHDTDTFNIFYGGVFVEVVNGQITHVDTLKEYIGGLVQSTREIYTHYTELTKTNN